MIPGRAWLPVGAARLGRATWACGFGGGRGVRANILVLGCLIRAVVPKGVDEAERAAPSCISQFFHPFSSV